MTPIAVAVVEHKGRYLIGRRPAGVALAGLWEFPGGKIEPGESPQQAAARECREETGVEIEIRGLHSHLEYDYDHGPVELHFFDCAAIGDHDPRPPFTWVARESLSDYDFPPANAELVARITARS